MSSGFVVKYILILILTCPGRAPSWGSGAFAVAAQCCTTPYLQSWPTFQCHCSLAAYGDACRRSLPHLIDTFSSISGLCVCVGMRVLFLTVYMCVWLHCLSTRPIYFFYFLTKGGNSHKAFVDRLNTRTELKPVLKNLWSRVPRTENILLPNIFEFWIKNYRSYARNTDLTKCDQM